MRLSKEQIEALKAKYEGKKVHVISPGTGEYLDTWGKVTSVDDQGHLHGTWGEQRIIPGVDYIGLDD